MRKFKNYTIILIVIILIITACEKSSNNTTTTKEESTIININSNYKKGVWEENIYKNETLNITFTLPESFQSMTIEELKTSQAMSEKDVLFLQTDNIIYDMFLIDNEKNYILQLLIADLNNLTEQETKIDEKSILDLYVSQLTSDTSIKYILENISSIELGGNKFLSLTVHNDENKTSQLYMVKNYDSYMATFIGLFNTEDTEDFKAQMKMFKPLKLEEKESIN